MPLVNTSLGRIFATTTGHLDTVIKGLDAAFSEARAVAPSVLFIDELDSLPDRATLSDRGRDWWSPVCNHFLKLLDEQRHGVIVLAATNLVGRIDAAILRPGRIDRHFKVELPTEPELVMILRLYLHDEFSEDEISSLAPLAQGLTGAGVALAVKTARAEARREGRRLELRDLIDRIAPDNRNIADLHRISVHEAGHALVAILLNKRVSYVSTVPGSGYGGASLIEMTGPIATRCDLEDQVAISLAGRNAERLILGEASSGSHSDLRLATWLLAAMHGSFAMGDTLVQQAPIDSSPSLLADPEFRSLVEVDMRRIDERCAQLLVSNVDALKRIIANLLEHRVLAEDQVLKLARLS